MFLRITCLLALAAVSVTAQVVDLSSDEYLMFDAYYPGDPGSSHDTLELIVLFDRKDVWNFVSSMVIFASSPGGDRVDHMLAVLNRNGAFMGPLESNFEITGVLDGPGDSSDSSAVMDLIWEGPNDGYCRTYSLMIIGVNKSNALEVVNKQIRVDGPDGHPCAQQEP